MKRLVIDTNVYTGLKHDDGAVTDALARADDILVCATVLGELLCGFKCGSREERNRKELELFLDTPRVRVVQSDAVTAEFYAEIYSQLRSSGRPLPTNDMWIAAVAKERGIPVATADRHFENIPGLLLIHP